MRKKTTDQLLIEKFVATPINWPREMKILKKLLQNNSEDFLKFCVLSFKAPSLAWFLTPDGKTFLAEQKKLFSTLETKQFVPITEDQEQYIRITEQKKSVFD